MKYFIHWEGSNLAKCIFVIFLISFIAWENTIEQPKYQKGKISGTGEITAKFGYLQINQWDKIGFQGISNTVEIESELNVFCNFEMN